MAGTLAPPAAATQPLHRDRSRRLPRAGGVAQSLTPGPAERGGEQLLALPRFGIRRTGGVRIAGRIPRNSVTVSDARGCSDHGVGGCPATVSGPDRRGGRSGPCQVQRSPDPYMRAAPASAVPRATSAGGSPRRPRSPSSRQTKRSGYAARPSAGSRRTALATAADRRGVGGVCRGYPPPGGRPSPAPAGCRHSVALSNGHVGLCRVFRNSPCMRLWERTGKPCTTLH